MPFLVSGSGKRCAVRDHPAIFAPHKTTLPEYRDKYVRQLLSIRWRKAVRQDYFDLTVVGCCPSLLKLEQIQARRSAP